MAELGGLHGPVTQAIISEVSELLEICFFQANVAAHVFSQFQLGKAIFRGTHGNHMGSIFILSCPHCVKLFTPSPCDRGPLLLS